jgi:hypothetical protein
LLRANLLSCQRVESIGFVILKPPSVKLQKTFANNIASTSSLQNFAPTSSRDADIFAGDVPARRSFAGRTPKQEKIAWIRAGGSELRNPVNGGLARKQVAKVCNALLQSGFLHRSIEKAARAEGGF